MSRASHWAIAAIVAIALTALACAKERRSEASGPVQQGAPLATKLLFARADSLYSAAEYEPARSVYDSVIHVAGTGGDSVTVALAWTNLGLLARKEGRFDESKSIGERALALKQRLGLQREIPKSLNALGLVAQSRGELEEAERLFEATRAAAEALHDSGYVVKAHANLGGLVYPDLAEFDRARSELLEAAAGAKALGDSLTETNSWNNLGRLEARVGDPDRAIASLEPARVRYERLQYVPGIENSLGQLGYAYALRGEPSRAIAYLDSARAVAAKYGLREEEADDTEITAEVYELVGDHKRALDLLQHAYALDDSLRMSTKLGQTLLEEAYVYAALNDLGLAQERAREAADEQRGAGARLSELEALVYVAELAQRRGDSIGAQSALVAARGVTSAIGSGVARIKLALGTARVADLAKHPEEVLAALGGSSRDFRLLMASELAEVEALRARAYFRTRRYTEAATAGRRAVASLEAIRARLDVGALRASFTAQQVDTYSDLVITLLTLKRVDEAFRIADAARGRSLVERLSAAGKDLRTSASATDLAAAEELLRRIDVLVSRLRATDAKPRDDRSAVASADEITQQLRDARTDYERLIDRVTRIDTSAAILGATTLDATAVRGSLGPREALVEFLVTDDRVLVFVLRGAAAQWMSVPIARSELAERVRLARELIASRDSASIAPLHALYNTLIEPIERAGFLNEVTSLVIVPHAALAYLPFAALRGPDSRYLVERYSIMSLSSASALPALRHRSDADFARPATVLAPLPSELPATREEARAVAQRMQGARLVVGASATERALREALASSPIVHVASHGALNRDNPMFSSIRLATPAAARETSEDNGRLETYEVLSSPVRSRLVFLSGCETGLGDAWSSTFTRGEDYATFAQAFLFAGAHNVVATLWRINDRAATAFAQKFYEQINNGRLADALAAAQRAFLADRRYAAPFYWAGYSLSGSGDLGRIAADGQLFTSR